MLACQTSHTPTMDTENFTNWLEIDLSAARNNVRELQRISGKPVMAIVKANAYGHGLAEVARVAVEAGSPWLGVARFEEALALRRAGISARVLVLGYTRPGRVPEALAENITLTVAEPETARSYSTAAASLNQPLMVHAKIDTGMGRLGVLAQDGVAFLQHIQSLENLDVEGIFTHFARSDEPEQPATNEQLFRFVNVLAGLNALGLCPRLVHSANSAAAIYFPETRFDMVRAGIALYGMDPSDEAPAPAGLQRMLKWKTRLVSVKYLPAGHGVGYGHRYTTSTVERVGVIAAGYADGLRRKVGVNFCLIHGTRVPVIGGVPMDQCMVSLENVPDARVGDEVVLIGRQGEQIITPEEMGAAWGTLNYEVTCGLAARIPRVYINV
jgi:alanine racemase